MKTRSPRFLLGSSTFTAAAAVLLWASLPASIRAQTGVYTLSSGSSTQASLSETTSTADQHRLRKRD